MGNLSGSAYLCIIISLSQLISFLCDASTQYVQKYQKRIFITIWYSVVVVQNVAPQGHVILRWVIIVFRSQNQFGCRVAYFEASQKGCEAGSKSYDNNSSKWCELDHSHWTSFPSGGHEACAEAAAGLRGHKKYRATCIKYLSKKLVRTCVLYIVSQTSFNTWTSHLEGIDNY